MHNAMSFGYEGNPICITLVDYLSEINTLRIDRQLGHIRHILGLFNQLDDLSNSHRLSFVSECESTKHFVVFESLDTNWS